MSGIFPDWLDPAPWMEKARGAPPAEILRAIAVESPGPDEFAALLAPAAGSDLLERMARRAQRLTHRHFGKTISLYVPLYLSNYCSGGCAYCGFASDRAQPRRRLEKDEILAEMRALKASGFEDILILTGERCPEADFAYLMEAVEAGARVFHHVAVESFAMTGDEYAALERAGCAGVTLYQETYDPVLYEKLHRWGPKRDYAFRLETPARALDAGMRTVGLGVLLGLGDPIPDLIALYRHAAYLRHRFWRGGVAISFPRVCPSTGGYQPARAMGETLLARAIFAFRICLPDVPLVLSTRERPVFRDGIAGVGIVRMSVASRTTVGGYAGLGVTSGGQFDVRDTRGLDEFRAALRAKQLEPVFKNWDRVFQAGLLQSRSGEEGRNSEAG